MAKLPRRCKFCGLAFIALRSDGWLCSQSCRNRYWRVVNRPKQNLPLKPCDTCGKSFAPYRSSNRYCSPDCRINSDANRLAKEQYDKSGKRRENNKKWAKSPAGKEFYRRWAKSESAKRARAKQEKRPEVKLRRKLYRQTEAGKKVQAKYAKSDKGKANYQKQYRKKADDLKATQLLLDIVATNTIIKGLNERDIATRGSDEHQASGIA